MRLLQTSEMAAAASASASAPPVAPAAVSPTAMEMVPRQRDALLAAVRLSRERNLHDHEDVLLHDARAHPSMEAFSKAFTRRFGELAARRDRTLLLHAGCSLVDRTDDVGLPIQAVGWTESCVVLLLRAAGPHRLVGAPSDAYYGLHALLEAEGVGPVRAEPWTEPALAQAAAKARARA